MSLERLWAGWRSAYVESAAAADEQDEGGCVFCRILASSEPDDRTYVVWRDERCAAVLNAFPYTTGHLLVMPVRHVSDLEDLTGEEAGAVWGTVARAVQALKAAYQPDGLNLGANIGRPAGAGIPGHFHVHVLPRWLGDTNFLTAVAETRVLPEPLPITYLKVRTNWPP